MFLIILNMQFASSFHLIWSFLTRQALRVRKSIPLVQERIIQHSLSKPLSLEMQVKETLSQAFALGDPASDIAQKAAELHKQWLCFYWKEYSKDAHAGLAQMYVDDERFTAYYDKEQPGTAEFLRDAIHIYTGMKK